MYGSHVIHCATKSVFKIKRTKEIERYKRKYTLHSFFYYYKNQENRPEVQCSYFLPVFQPEDVLNLFLFSIHFQFST